MSREKVLEEIIEGYRKTVSKRYQYQHIKDTYGLPETIDEDTVNQLREYFLSYIYPTPDKRAELNKAFDSLDDYIKHPQKLLRILLEAAKIIFKYGRHLPKILSAGLDAIKTFKAATSFENTMVDQAIKNEIKAPYNSVKIDVLLKLLSREEIEKFIESSQTLFEILHDKNLIKKIKEVIQHLVDVMQKKPKTYSQSQIKGLKIGLEMITEGDLLFNRLSEQDQQKFIKLITDIEKDTLNLIF